MRTGSRNPGEFCWINILSSQLSEARAFYGKLLRDQIRPLRR